jgi:hypothetical protein
VSATSESSSATATSPVSPLRALDTEVVIDGRFTIDRTPPVPPRGPRPATRDERLRRALVLGDFVAITLAAILQAVANGFSKQWPLLLLAVPLWLVVAGVRDLYRSGAWRWDHAGLEEFGSILAVTAQWGLISLVVGWASGMVSVVKVGPLAIGWIVTVAAVLLAHAFVRARARRQPWYWENAIVLGAPEQNDRVVRRLSRLRRLGVHVVACVEPAATENGDPVARSSATRIASQSPSSPTARSSWPSSGTSRSTGSSSPDRCNPSVSAISSSDWPTTTSTSTSCPSGASS